MHLDVGEPALDAWEQQLGDQSPQVTMWERIFLELVGGDVMNLNMREFVRKFYKIDLSSVLRAIFFAGPESLLDQQSKTDKLSI